MPFRWGEDAAVWPEVLEGPVKGLLSTARAAVMRRDAARDDVLSRLVARFAALPVRSWFAMQDQRSPDWCRADLDMVARLDATQRPWLLGVATLAENGRVREAAVRALAAEAPSLALRFVVPRCCDWVPQVATAAFEVLQLLLARGAGEALVEVAASAVPWLRRRWRSGPAYEALRDALAAPQFAAGLRAAWTAAEPEVRALALELTLPHEPPAAALQAGQLEDPSGSVRFLVAGHLGAVAAQLTDDEVARVLQARQVLVLKRFLAVLPVPVVGRHRERLLDLVCAPRRAPRIAAVAALYRAGIPALPLLRERFAARPHAPSPGLVAAIGELGGRADAASLQPLLQISQPALLAAAIGAVARLAGIDDAALIDWLAHRVGVVRRAAANALLTAPRHRWTAAVRVVALGDGVGAPIATALLLRGATRRNWTALPDLLIGLGAGPSLARRARAALQGWCERNMPRGWLAPDAVTLDWLRRLGPGRLAAHATALPDSVMQWLGQRLREAGLRGE